MKRKIVITFSWWHDEAPNVESEHEERLESAAMERISQLLPDGYTSGELHEEIEGIYYNGWWDMESHRPTKTRLKMKEELLGAMLSCSKNYAKGFSRWAYLWQERTTFLQQAEAMAEELDKMGYELIKKQ
ncbi:MAG: hypothetical protein GYA14_15935 [Ignavibacteria bacterium]|nr:hypothetical protein [Ignavibacteria bacterium]